MVIESIRISAFGIFSDRSLAFGGGINIIEGENESGKTTLAAFLRFLFYGFEDREERAHYTARTENGDAVTVGGSLDCTVTGEDGKPVRYRIARTLEPEDPSVSGHARITDLAANTRVFSDREPWEVFFGVP